VAASFFIKAKTNRQNFAAKIGGREGDRVFFSLPDQIGYLAWINAVRTPLDRLRGFEQNIEYQGSFQSATGAQTIQRYVHPWQERQTGAIRDELHLGYV